MKLSLLFFFAITSPFFIFLTEMLYGGTTPASLKKGLAEASIYKDLSAFLITTEPQGEQDLQTSEISKLIYNRFTPEYLQIKTEKLIDDSYVWVTANGEPPVLSFTDMKEDIRINDPELQAQIEQMTAATQGLSAEESLNEYARDPEALMQADPLTALAQNDFTVPVGEYFQWIKTSYNIARIVHPIIAILLLGSLLLLIKQNHNWPARFRWIGATLITTSIFGFGMILFNTISVEHLLQVTMSNPENFLAAFSPVLLQLMHIFMERYAYFQIIANYVMLALAVGCFVALFVMKMQSKSTKLNVSQKK